DEDFIAPDDRRGPGHSRERGLPFNVVRWAPLVGEAGFGGGAVVSGAAPMGPVGGVERQQAGNERQENEFEHAKSLRWKEFSKEAGALKVFCHARRRFV